MDAAKVDVWRAIAADTSRGILEKLGSFVDLDAPPDFADYVREQWAQAKFENIRLAWDLLVEGQLILQAVALPNGLDIEEAGELARLAKDSDPLFDTKLLRRLLSNRLWPDEVPSDEILRCLEILERLDDAQRLSMTLLKFVRFPCKRVQSKVAKVLGRSIDNLSVVEEIYLNPDSRVRANLIQGIGMREDPEPFMHLVERATKDQNHRVSSIALAIRGRHGHKGSLALIRMRTSSKADIVRKSAEFAKEFFLAAGDSQAPDLSTHYAAEPAAMTAISEVDQQPQAHPNEQP